MIENNIMYLFQILVVISFCIWIVYVSRIIIFYSTTIKKWKRTNATIIDCEVNWFRSKTDSDNEGWQEIIKYNYTVNSIEYKNDCVTKNIRFLSPSKNFVKNYGFKKNQKVEIAYDPLNPQKSIIDLRFNFLTLIIPIFFYLITYLFVFNWNTP